MRSIENAENYYNVGKKWTAYGKVITEADWLIASSARFRVLQSVASALNSCDDEVVRAFRFIGEAEASVKVLYDTAAPDCYRKLRHVQRAARILERKYKITNW
jgi:hypothetical protein